MKKIYLMFGVYVLKQQNKKNIRLTSTITIINKKYFNVFFSNQLILYIYSWDLYVCV